MAQWRTTTGADPLGPLERELMGVLWQSDEPMTVREVLSVVNGRRAEPLAYTTVMTTLARLADKGLAARDRAGRAHRYWPVASDIASVAVRQVVSEFGDEALASFVDQVSDDADLRARLTRLLEQEPG